MPTRMLTNVLAIPRMYELFTRITGGPMARVRFARDYIRPGRSCRILDIGCGPGSMVPHLAGAEYVGFDASPEYIAAARRQFGDRATFVCERVSAATLDAPGTYDIVLASGILHHLDDDEARTLFDVAKSALKDGGRLITLDGAYVPGQSRAARYIISRDRGQHVRAAPEYSRLAREVFVDVKSDVVHDLLRIPYTHVILQCTR